MSRATMTSSHLYEQTYGYLVRLADEPALEQLTYDQQVLIAEAFEALTDSGADAVEALFPLPGPPLSTRELIEQTIRALEQIVAESSDLGAGLRFTRALDLMRAAHDVGRT